MAKNKSESYHQPSLMIDADFIERSPHYQQKNRNHQMEVEGNIQIGKLQLGQLRIALDPLGPIADVICGYLSYKTAIKALEVERERIQADFNLKNKAIDAAFQIRMKEIDVHYQQFNSAIDLLKENFLQHKLNQETIRCAIKTTMEMVQNPRELPETRKIFMETVVQLTGMLKTNGTEALGLLEKIVEKHYNYCLNSPSVRGLLGF